MAVCHSVDPARWRVILDEAMTRVAGRFVRAEPRATAGQFVEGLLSEAERKTYWSLAERAGHGDSQAMQRLLRTAVWQPDAVRDDMREWLVEQLGHPDAVLVTDETGFLKKGVCPVGVQRQYTGTAGRIENSQVAVFLAYVTPAGRAMIDRRLYLPETTWCDQPDRLAAASVPDDLRRGPDVAERQRHPVRAHHPGVRRRHGQHPPGRLPPHRLTLRPPSLGQPTSVGLPHPSGRPERVKGLRPTGVKRLVVAAWAC